VLSDPVCEYPRDVAGNVHFVGHPLAEIPANISDNTIARFINGATASLVVISLGNHGSWNSKDRTLEIASALRTQLPKHVRVIWKVSVVDKDVLQHELQNQCTREEEGVEDEAVIKFVDWMPQNDMFGHIHARVIVSHGGMNSVQEAAYHGVPVVGTALMADQFDNLARCVRHGFGQSLDAKSFTSEMLVDKVNNVFLDPKYTHAAR